MEWSGKPLEICILIASKDGSKTIGQTIKSATKTNVPIFVVSDGSTDQTVWDSEYYVASVLDLKTNVGKPAALYTAVQHFGLLDKFDAIAILDDDTVISPDFIRESEDALNRGAAIVVGHTQSIWNDNNKWNIWVGSRAYSYWRYQLLVRRGQSAINTMNCISGSNSVYRSDVLRKVLLPSTPYIVDDTFWTLETHRQRLGRIVYAPRAKAWVQDPTNFRDWYKQNLRWLWGSFQGIVGHRVGRRATVFDIAYLALIVDWALYIFGWVIFLAVQPWLTPKQSATFFIIGYAIWAALAAIALGKWRLVIMTPALIVVDMLYRIVFIHAAIKTWKQPTVESCKWDSPKRFEGGLT